MHYLNGRTSFIPAVLAALHLAEASISRVDLRNLQGKDTDMEREGEIGDPGLPVKKLDGENGEGKQDASEESSESDSDIDDRKCITPFTITVNGRKFYCSYESESDDDEDIGVPIYDCPPSQDTNRFWQWHFPREFPVGCVEYDYQSGSGKWMLFYQMSEIDEKWEMAKDLFDTGELRGVRGMKVSTAMDNPRSSDNATAVLLMYCGPWTDEPLMRTIGANLALKTKYESKIGCMTYKTDDQTEGGTRATGQTVNHVYQMQVPRPVEGTASTAMPELLPSEDTRDHWQWHYPKCSPSGCAKEYDYSKSGRWMLFYSLAEIDEKWQMMKDLFDSNELDGVRGLKVSTASSPQGNQGDNSSAVIMVYCGPWDDEDLVLRVGANLVQKTSYKDKSGFLRYKTDIVGKGTASSGQLMWRYKQVFPVPRPRVGANYSQSSVANLPPSKDMRSYWQWHPKSQDGRFTNYDLSLRGKWMLFYPSSDIDGMWQLVKDLFDARELQGVSDAKVSTAKSIAGHPEKNSGVIMVYCGPCDDAELMLKIGENVALKTKYKDKSGIMRYEVDAPREGRRATDKSSPSYWLQVPKPQAMWASALDTAENPPSRDTAECLPSRDTAECLPSRDTSESMPSRDTAECRPSRDTAECPPSRDTAECPPSRDTAECLPSRDTAECLPSRDTSESMPSRDTAECRPSRDTAECPPSRDAAEFPPSRDKRNLWQWHRKPLNGIKYDPSTSGKWMLFYPTSEIDDRWHLVKSLFNAGELHGVGELKVNVGHYNSGVINVYCGPYDDGELMMRIGENLAKKMQYKNRNGVMLYKTEGQQMKHARAMRQGWDHLYEIDLPWRY